MLIHINIASAGLFDFLTSRKNTQMPEFVGISGWINSKPLNKKQLAGKVVLIDFWTYSCINCIRTFPALRDWHRKYKNKGLVIIGVHAPEFDFEKDIDNVKAASKRYKLTYPIAIDNRMLTWQAYKNRYWPAKYLIDSNGMVVYEHFGEGAYEDTELMIRKLLNIEGEDNLYKSTMSADREQTSEIYLGTWRSQHYKGGLLTKGRKVLPKSIGMLASDNWGISGIWDIDTYKIITRKKNSRLKLRFKSKQLYLVLGGKTGKKIKVRMQGAPPGSVFGKDAPGGIVTIDKYRLYHLAELSKFTQSVVTLDFDAGIESYAFTFGLE